MIPLEQCYAKYQGTSILIPRGGEGNNGQCVQWADTVLYEVYGQPYIYTPAAIDWWNKADQLGLTTHFDKISRGQPIKKGDFVIYDSRVGSEFGHIDVAAANGTTNDFVAYDSNWGGKTFYKNGYPMLHTVRHNDVYNNYIVGYLRHKGEDMPPDPNQIKFLLAMVYRGQPITDADAKALAAKSNWGDAINALLTDGRAQRAYDNIDNAIDGTAPGGSVNVKPYSGPALFVEE